MAFQGNQNLPSRPTGFSPLPEHNMGQQWYYIVRGTRGGPVSASDLKQMAAGRRQ